MDLSEQLIEALNNGTCMFRYTKAKGEIRCAIGTKKVEEIPSEFLNHSSTDTISRQPDHLVIYYDLQKKGWRRCRKDSIIDIL